jgi:hypothetical protein
MPASRQHRPAGTEPLGNPVLARFRSRSPAYVDPLVSVAIADRRIAKKSSPLPNRLAEVDLARASEGARPGTESATDQRTRPW